MITAFAARSIIDLKARDKSKIESVLFQGDRIFVGLNTGSLRIYRVKDPADSRQDGESRPDAESGPNPLVELLREEEKFSRRGVQQLAIIKEAALLISMSDGYVSFHDLETYTLTERLEKTKGVQCFATSRNIDIDSETGIHSIVSRLAVAVKRKILVWTWRDFELTAEAEELMLPATIKSLTWCSSGKVVVGMDPGFSIIDLSSGTVTEVNRAATAGEAAGPNGTRFGAVSSSGMGYMGMGSWVPKPLATKLNKDEVLLAKDVNSLFINLEGQSKEKRQVPWATAPDALAYSYPYLLALHGTKGTLDLRNPETLNLLQSIPLPGAVILHVPQPNISLAHAGKGFLVASERSIWRMDARDYGAQIDELVDLGRFDEALSFVSLIEDTLLLDKQTRLQQIKVEKALALFYKRDFREALDLFSTAPARPDQVISLYPESIAGELSSSREFAGNESSDKGSSEPVAGSPVKPPLEISSPKRTRMSNVRNSVDSETASLRSSSSVDERDVHSPRFLGKCNPERRSSTEGRELKVAVNELRAFLAQTRVQLQKYIGYDGKLKPPALTRTRTGEDELPGYAWFIEYSASDAEDVLEKKLLDVATLVDTTLFRAYMLVSPSLAGSLFRLDNFCAANVVEAMLYENGRYHELVDFLWGKKLYSEVLMLLEKFGKDETTDEALADFRGPVRTIQYLQQLPFEQIDLILERAKWPMETNPDAGLEIFTADTENAESLPREQVVAFLESFGNRVVVKYLEHIINELGDETTAFHDKLVLLYADTIKEKDDAVVREKLETLLQTSTHYDRNKVLDIMPRDSRAIVLGKLAFHRDALRIYVFQMQDIRKAEEYCNRVYLTLLTTAGQALDPDDTNRPQSIYTTLLSLYLSPPHPHKQNLDAALELLSLHGSRLPALSTLEALPESLPIKNLESYFRARMRAANSLAREEAVVASLSKVEKLACEAELAFGDNLDPYQPKTSPRAGRNRRVVLGENKLCSVCHKRFGRATARVFPDGDVVHYGCSDRRAAQRQQVQ